MGDERDQPLDLPLLGLGGKVARRRRQAVDRLGRPLPRLHALLGEELARGIRGCGLAGELELDHRVLVRARAHHGVGGVLRLPAIGKLELESEIRVQERRALKESLPRVCAVHHAVDPLEILFPAHGRVAQVLVQRVQPGFGDLDPVPGIGVGRQPLRYPTAPAQLARGLERLEHVDHLPNVIALVQGVPEPRQIRLILRVPPVLEEQDAQPLTQGAAELGHCGVQDRADSEPDLRDLGPRDLLHRVSVGHVPDLVPDHGGQLRLVCDRCHEPAGHENEPPGQGERVDRGVVHDVELPGELWPLGSRGHLHADARHIGLDRRVVVVPDALGDALGVLPAHLDLLGLGHQGKLALAGNGVDGACDGQPGAEQEPDQSRTSMHDSTPETIVRESTTRRAGRP